MAPYRNRSASSRGCARSSTSVRQQHKRWVRDQGFGTLHSASSTIRREVSNNGKPTFALGSRWIRIGGAHVEYWRFCSITSAASETHASRTNVWPTSIRINGRRTQDRLDAAISAAELGRMDIARPEFESVAAVWGPSSGATGKSFNYEKWFGDPAIARKLLAKKGKLARAQARQKWNV